MLLSVITHLTDPETTHDYPKSFSPAIYFLLDGGLVSSFMRRFGLRSNIVPVYATFGDATKFVSTPTVSLLSRTLHTS